MTQQPIPLSAASPYAALIIAHASVYATLLDGLPLAIHSIRAGLNRSGLGPEDVALLRLVDRIGALRTGSFALGGDKAVWSRPAGGEGDSDSNDNGDGESNDRRQWSAAPSGGRTSAAGLVLAALPLALLNQPIVQTTHPLASVCSPQRARDDSKDHAASQHSPSRRASGTSLSPPLSVLSLPADQKLGASSLPSTEFQGGQVFRSRRLRITGGCTSAGPTFPSAAYLSLVLLPFLATHWPEAASSVKILVDRAGFPPAGGAVLTLSVGGETDDDDRARSQLRPVLLRPIDLVDRGSVVRIAAHVFRAGRKTPNHVLSRLADSLIDALRKAEVVNHHGGLLSADVPFHVCLHRETLDGSSEGEKQPPRPTTAQLERQEAGAVVIAHTASGCRLAVEGTTEMGRFAPEEVGQRLARSLLNELGHGGCIDSTLQVRSLRNRPFLPRRPPS